MTEELSTISNFSVATTMNEDDAYTVDQTSAESTDYYVQWVVIVIGVVGTTGNSLILYALVASKQHKKHMLIFNQNVLDLFGSFFLIVTRAARILYTQPYEGASGYYICLTIMSGVLTWWGLIGSVINLAIITIDRYLKIVHHAWSNTHVRPWMIRAAMAFSWFAGIVANTSLMYHTSGVINGKCVTWVLYETTASRIISLVWYIVAYYVVILAIFIYCYGRILVVIRRQAKVMASHGHGHAHGHISHAEAQSHRIQTNVIKTMVLVSAFYAIAWLPANVYYILIMTNTNLTYKSDFWNAAIFATFLYTSANPFIYATKFDPVRQVLKGMIPRRMTAVHSTVAVVVELAIQHRSNI